ncbi:MAG: amidohydrolase family protein [Thermoleophilia bacterium]
MLLTRCAPAGGSAGAGGACRGARGALFDLRYEGGVIRDLGALSPRPGEAVIDLGGAYLCAGLVDAHVHLALGGPMAANAAAGDGALPLSALGDRVAANAAAHLAHGVTAVRDLGGCVDGACVRDRAARSPEAGGTPPGGLPRVVSATAALTRRGNYGAFLGVALGPADDPADAVRERVAAGAAVIKVILTGSVDLERGTAAPAHFSFAELRSMIHAAQDLGVAVAVHANGAEAVRMAAEAGADSIEHGILLDEAAIQAMVDHDVVWVPTLTPLHALVAMARGAAVSRITNEHEAMVAVGRDAGVKIAAGTDAGSPGVPHGALLSEVAHLRSAGFSPAEARAAAGAVGAELLGLGEGHGSLSVGAATDLVWFERDPFVGQALDESRALRPLGVLPEA